MEETHCAESLQELPIIITLADSGDAHAFADHAGVIQRKAMRDFFRHVSGSLQKATIYRSFLEDRGGIGARNRYHDTVTISGSRGSGKTSFILTMFEFLKKPDQIPVWINNHGIGKGDLAVLEILDPTLIEEKDHIFVHLLSMIKDRVDEEYMGRSGRYDLRGQIRNTGPITDAQYEEWLNILRDLAAGLPCLDGVGSGFLTSEKWHDPIYVLETGLKNTSASNNFEIMFHRFVDRSLRLLGNKAFVIAFDDIDTNFKKGARLLEILHKYFTTPQFITILSGDLELYSILVRDQQWGNFSTDIINREPERIGYFTDLISRLESQYMLKLLKPERRIGLDSVENIMGRSDSKLQRNDRSAEISIKIFGSDTPKLLRDILDQYCRKIFYVIEPGSSYQRYMLREKLRSLIRILNIYMQNFSEDENLTLERNCDALLDICQTALQHYGFNADALRELNPETALNKLVIGLCKNEDLLISGYRLRPDYEEHEKNSLMVALAALISHKIATHPKLFFDYFVKVGLTREIALLLRSGGSKWKIQHYLDWVGLAEGDTGVTAARLFNGVLRGLVGARSSCFGTVQARRRVSGRLYEIVSDLYGFESIQQRLIPDLYEAITERHPQFAYLSALKGLNEKTAEAYLFNSLEQLENVISTWHWRLVNISVNRVIDSNNNTTVVWSFHNLISAIGELADCTDESEAEDVLIRLSQIRDYRQMLPAFKEDDSEGSENEDYNPHKRIRRRQGRIPKTFLTQLVTWAKSYPGSEVGLPVYILSKIFTRFYYSFGRVDSDVPNASKLLGSLVHRYIVLFLNSVLVEEALFRKTGQIRLTNPTNSDSIFTSNLRAIRKTDDNLDALPYSNWLLRFPMWIHFLNPDSGVADSINKAAELPYDHDPVNFSNDVEFKNLYDVLNSVILAGYRHPTLNVPGREQVGTGKMEKIRYSVAELNNVFEKRKSEIIEYLRDIAPADMAQFFAKKFLKPYYTYVPQSGSKIEGLKKRLVKFMRDNQPK
jgi:hypothetical protein